VATARRRSRRASSRVWRTCSDVQQHDHHDHRPSAARSRGRARGVWFKGSRKSTPFAAQVAAKSARRRRWSTECDRSPCTSRVRIGANRRPCDPGGRDQSDADQGRHADPAQRLSAEEAATRLEDIEWLATTMRCAALAVGEGTQALPEGRAVLHPKCGVGSARGYPPGLARDRQGETSLAR